MFVINSHKTRASFQIRLKSCGFCIAHNRFRQDFQTKPSVSPGGWVPKITLMLAMLTIPA